MSLSLVGSVSGFRRVPPARCALSKICLSLSTGNPVAPAATTGAATGVAKLMPMGTNWLAGMVASLDTLTGMSVARSISVAMVLTLWRPGRRSVTEAMWLGSISLRSIGMDWVVKRARWVVTTAGVGPG